MANTKITSRVLADNAVLTANITDANVTTAKVADNAVTGDKVADDVALAGNPTTTTQSAGNNTTRIATTAFVSTAVANLADSAPDALNTLNELAAAMGDDANFSTTITNSIAAKLPLAGGTMTGNIVMGDDTSIGIADDAERIEFDGAGDISFLGANVGIGTDSPSQKLDVVGKIKLTDDLIIGGTTPRIDYDGGSTGALRFYSTSTSSERMRISSSGNVGIGTDSPAHNLHVVSSGNAELEIERTSGAAIFTQAQSALGVTGTSSNHDFGLLTNGSVRMRILNDGKVGIGGTPQTTIGVLDIIGQSNNFNTAPMVTFKTTSTNAANRNWSMGAVDINYGDFHIGCGDSNSDFFDATANSKFTIDKDGKVGIGDTSPSYTLDVLASSGTAANFRGEGGPNGILIGGNDAGFGWLGSTGHANYDLAFNNSGYAHFGHGESTTFLYLGSQGGGWGGNSSHNLRASGATFMFNSGSGNYLFEIGGVQKGYINSSGFNNGSDVSLKENIENITYGLDTVKLLKPRKFDWKDAPADDKAEIGFIAQEVESIIPEIISESRSDGEGTSIKGMNYGALTSVLTKAIQEQQTIIEDLKARIETLEG